MTRLGAVFALIIMTCCAINLVEGEWIDAVATLGISIFVVREDRQLRRARARRDLREAYPPRRDQFHRDLERLNKLRGAPAAASPLDSATAQRRKLERKRTTHLGYVDVQAAMEHERSFQRRRRHTIAGPTYAILEGLRDGLLFMAPFLVLGAVIGLVVSLL